MLLVAANSKIHQKRSESSKTTQSSFVKEQRVENQKVKLLAVADSICSSNSVAIISISSMTDWVNSWNFSLHTHRYIPLLHVSAFKKVISSSYFAIIQIGWD